MGTACAHCYLEPLSVKYNYRRLDLGKGFIGTSLAVFENKQRFWGFISHKKFSIKQF